MSVWQYNTVCTTKCDTHLRTHKNLTSIFLVLNLSSMVWNSHEFSQKQKYYISQKHTKTPKASFLSHMVDKTPGGLLPKGSSIAPLPSYCSFPFYRLSQLITISQHWQHVISVYNPILSSYLWHSTSLPFGFLNKSEMGGTSGVWTRLQRNNSKIRRRNNKCKRKKLNYYYFCLSISSSCDFWLTHLRNPGPQDGNRWSKEKHLDRSRVCCRNPRSE